MNLVSQGLFQSTRDLTNWSSHAAWLTVVVIDLPTGLSAGKGTISVVTGAGIRKVQNATQVDDIFISIEILPDVDLGDGSPLQPGTPSPFEYYASQFSSFSQGDLSSLKSMKKAVVRSPVINGSYSGSSTIVSAVEYVLNVPLHNIADPSIVVPDTALMVIYEDNVVDYRQTATKNGFDGNVAAQTQMSWFREGDQVTVMLVSPTGQLRDRLIRLSIMPYSDSNYDFVSTPTIVNVRYFDGNGNIIPDGIHPEIVEVNF